MELKNCPECGHLFTYLSVNLCPACREKDQNDFQRVKEYLVEHPSVGIFHLAAAAEVDETKVIRWIREGRIEGKMFPGLAVPCERCQKPIYSGRYCQSCTDELVNGFKIAPEPPEEEYISTKDRFHIKSNKKS